MGVEGGGTSGVSNNKQFSSATCSVCLDGSDPLSSSDPFSASHATTATSTFTCDDIISTAMEVSEGSDACERMQLAGFQGNCCQASSYLVTPESFDRCPLCPGGEGAAFLPFKEIPAYKQGITATGIVTCSDLRSNATVMEAFLKEYIDSAGTCDDTALRRSAAWCGCYGSSIACELSCKGGDPVDMEQTHPLTGVSCQEISYQVALLDNKQCPQASLYLNFEPTALCCPSDSSLSSDLISCPLCTDMQGLTTDKTVTTETYGEATCGDAQAAANLLTSEQICIHLRQTFSQSCCFERQDDESVSTKSCELKCPSTGQGPPDLSREYADTGYSCSNMVAEYSNLTAAQCSNASSIIGFDAISFCCDDVDVDEPSESQGPVDDTILFDCRVCPPQQRLLYPSRVLFAYNELTCMEIERTASSITDESSCFRLLDESRALSNCACRHEQEEGIDEDGNGDAVIDVNGNDSGSGSRRLRNVWGSNLNRLFFLLLQAVIQ
jgi:hypothetical protein